MLAGWAYTGGPYPLGYHGLGDDAFDRMFDRDKEELRILGVPIEPLARYFEYWLLRLQGVYEDERRIVRFDLQTPPGLADIPTTKGVMPRIGDDYERRSLAHVVGLPEQLDAPGAVRGLQHRDPGVVAVEADCRPLRGVFYAQTDWLRLATSRPVFAPSSTTTLPGPCASLFWRRLTGSTPTQSALTSGLPA